MTGLRLPIDRIRKRIAKVREDAQASEFTPELDAYAGRVLKQCEQDTPARSEAVIREAQEKQWKNRIGYIPSVHTLENPTLITKDDGAEFLFFNGKWYRPDIHRVPVEVFGVYQPLLAERNRRMASITQEAFIAERVQARWLYKRSWWQVAESLNIRIPMAPYKQRSHTRRKPPVIPPRGYGQRRGGGRVISIVVYNPFLEIPSRYIEFDPRAILARAQARYRAKFVRDVENKTRRIIRNARTRL